MRSVDKYLIPNFQLYGHKKMMEPNRFFDIARIGKANKQYQSHYLPHRHTHLHELVWVSKGSLSLTIDEVQHTLTPNTLCIIAAGVVHESSTLPALDGFVLHFSSDFLLSAAGEASAWKLADFQGIPPLAVTATKTAKRLSALFTQIDEEFSLEGPERDDLIRHYLNIVMLEVQRVVGMANTTQLDRSAHLIFQRFQALVEQQHASLRQVSAYAEQLDITPNYLTMLCKHITGRTAGQFIRDRIVLEAKRLLLFSGATVSEVAYALNYEDVSYFWRMFKKEVKLSPSAFKRRHAHL